MIPSDDAGKQNSAAWTRELEGLTTTIQARARKQQRLLDRTQAPGDVSRAKMLIKSYIAESANDISAARDAMRKLNAECGASRNAMLIRTTRALGASLQRASEESSQIEAQLVERIRVLDTQAAARRDAVVVPVPSSWAERDDGGGEGNDTGMTERGADGQLQLATAAAPQRQLTQELFEAAFHERSAEIGALASGLREINGMMQDLHAMVVDQGASLDAVEANIVVAHGSSVKAAGQLRKAAGHQGEASRQWLVMAGVIFFIILVIGAVVAAR